MGRFHLIRVILALVFVILFIAIIAKRQEENAIINISDAEAMSTLSWVELDNLSQANSSCPVCFGRDACHELMTDVSRGALQVSKQSQQLTDLGQTVHGIYRHGKIRFWMKPQPASPSLVQGFEKAICEQVGK